METFLFIGAIGGWAYILGFALRVIASLLGLAIFARQSCQFRREWDGELFGRRK
jgi:hypothetical protein